MVYRQSINLLDVSHLLCFVPLPKSITSFAFFSHSKSNSFFLPVTRIKYSSSKIVHGVQRPIKYPFRTVGSMVLEAVAHSHPQFLPAKESGAVAWHYALKLS